MTELTAGARAVVLVAFLIAVSWTDSRCARIRNAHTFPAMAIGLGLGLIGGGLEGLTHSAWGLFAAFLIMLPLFALNVMKAGDAKMMMAVGALMGAELALRAVIASTFLYVPIALVILLGRGAGGNIGQALKRLWRFFYTTVHPLLKREALVAEGAVWTPYGAVLALSTLLVWQTNFLRF